MKGIEINKLHPLAVNATKELRRLGLLKPNSTEEDWSKVASVIQTVCRLNGLCMVAVGNTKDGWDLLNQMAMKLRPEGGLEIGMVRLDLQLLNPPDRLN